MIEDLEYLFGVFACESRIAEDDIVLVHLLGNKFGKNKAAHEVGKDLEYLIQVFHPKFSFKDIGSAYCQANFDVNKGAAALQALAPLPELDAIQDLLYLIDSYSYSSEYNFADLLGLYCWSGFDRSKVLYALLDKTPIVFRPDTPENVREKDLLLPRATKIQHHLV